MTLQMWRWIQMGDAGLGTGMKRLIECVPNFSEGRDPARVDALVAAMSAVEGVYVLDREMDADHNRCVITPRSAASATASGSPASVMTQRLWSASPKPS